MRRCGRCERSLPESEFHRHGTGLQTWCKGCKKAYAADHYQRNKEARKAHNREQRRRAATWYQSLKADRPCADCGRSFHPAAMEWDHLPGQEKIAEVGSLYGGSRERVLTEIAKCELVT